MCPLRVQSYLTQVQQQPSEVYSFMSIFHPNKSQVQYIHDNCQSSIPIHSNNIDIRIDIKYIAHRHIMVVLLKYIQ